MPTPFHKPSKKIKEMFTIKSPDTLSSFAESVAYTITTDDNATTQITVSLIDDMSGEVIASRRLTLANGEATTDFAQLLRRRMTLQPIDGTTGLAAAEGCNAYVRLKVGEQTSPITTCVAAPHDNMARCVTTMPLKREMARNECDTLLLLLPDMSNITLEAHTPQGSTTEELRWDGDAGMVTLRVKAMECPEEVERIVARLEGVVVAEWRITPPSGEGMRLAWRTPHGSMEHYTFPYIERRRCMVERQSIRSDKGSITTSVARNEQATISSRYEPSATIAALAGIISSPQVWAIDEAGKYVPIEIVSTEVTSNERLKPSKISLTINLIKE